MNNDVRLVDFSKVFFDNSWNWLNDPEIKKMTATPDFTKEDQLKWFNSLPSKQDYLIWGVAFDHTPIGVCGLKNITDMDCEYWGYIGNKEYWGRGVGRGIMHDLEEIARSLAVKSIWLRVLIENERAVTLYKKMGYNIERQEEFLIMRKYL